MDEPVKSTAMGAATPSTFAQLPSAWGLPGTMGQWLTSYDTQTKDGKAKLLRVFLEDGEKPEAFVNMEFKIADATIFPIGWQRDDGEKIETTRVVFETADGRFIDFRSSGILKSFMLLCNLDHEPSPKSPLSVKLVRRQLSGERSMYSLLPVEIQGKKKNA